MHKRMMVIMYLGVAKEEMGENPYEYVLHSRAIMLDIFMKEPSHIIWLQGKEVVILKKVLNM